MIIIIGGSLWLAILENCAGNESVEVVDFPVNLCSNPLLHRWTNGVATERTPS